MGRAVRGMFGIFLVGAGVVGILMDNGVLSNEGFWLLQHRPELLQAQLVSSTALIALSAFFLSQGNVHPEKQPAESREGRGQQARQMLLSWSIIAGFVSLLTALGWFMKESWLLLYVSMYMFLFQLAMSFVAIIFSKALRL